MSWDYFVHVCYSTLHLLFLILGYIAFFPIFCLHLMFRFIYVAYVVWLMTATVSVFFWD